jgi:hypothetical protein
MPSESTVFIAAIILIACALVSGLAWVCRYTHQEHPPAPRRKSSLSNWR